MPMPIICTVIWRPLFTSVTTRDVVRRPVVVGVKMTYAPQVGGFVVVPLVAAARVVPEQALVLILKSPLLSGLVGLVNEKDSGVVPV